MFYSTTAGASSAYKWNTLRHIYIYVINKKKYIILTLQYTQYKHKREGVSYNEENLVNH